MRLRLLALYFTVAAWSVVQQTTVLSQTETSPTPSLRKLPLIELRTKAEQGDPNAQRELADRYSDGRGVVLSEYEALKWYRQAAENGDAEAQRKLGGAYFVSLPPDTAEGVKWYRKAAEQGDAYAQYDLGYSYEIGRGVAQDQAEALKWYRKAFEQLSIAANQGDAKAMRHLGHMYVSGHGVAKNETEAAKCYRIAMERYHSAAEQGDSEAQWTLGYLYEDGEGTAKDETEALKWFRKAAERGDISKQLVLAGRYATGNGTAKDETEAARWYRKAAEQGDPAAQWDLGYVYMNGRGVTKDESEAAKWYRKSAAQGDADRQYDLGQMLFHGSGLAKDMAEGAKWLRMAAEQGLAYAQHSLGNAYLYGWGVAKDEVQAYKWYLLAGAQGEENSETQIARTERVLTPSQRAEGQRLAREWKPRTELAPGTAPTPEQVAESKPGSTGTAFAITEDGYFITNEHVVEDGGTVRLLTSSGLLNAKVVRTDKANDLALLKVEGRFPALSIAASRGVRLGATVATVGFPNPGLQGFAPKLAKGEVASLSGAQDDARQFQVSIPIQPGNSGGAMVDERGNVIGVIVAKLSQKAALATTGTLAENVNYAIKSSFLLGFLESVPEVAARLKDASTKARAFEDVVQDVEKATALVLVY